MFGEDDDENIPLDILLMSLSGLFILGILYIMFKLFGG